MRYKVTKFILAATRSVIAVFVVLGLIVSASVSAGGHKETASPTEGMNIVATANAAGTFTKLLAALDQAGLTAALSDDGPYTVFAPSDEAFAKFWPGTIDNLMMPENKEALKTLLLFHVVPGEIKSADLSGTVSAENLQGGTLTIVAGDVVTVNRIKVVAVDIEASNGVIHVIDQVIVPIT